MKKILLAALLASVSFSSFAQTQQWYTIDRSADDHVFDVQLQSGKFEKNGNGENVYMAMFRYVFQGKTEYFQEYVRLSDCAQGYGETTAVDLRGNFLYSNNMNLSGETIADAIARALCGSATAAMKQYKEKSVPSI